MTLSGETTNCTDFSAVPAFGYTMLPQTADARQAWRVLHGRAQPFHHHAPGNSRVSQVPTKSVRLSLA